MERHPEAISRFGKPDGTLKIYDLPIPPGVDKYREQAETSEIFAAHNDGLGYGGAITVSMISLDSPPAWGGYTCFQQFIRLSLALANDDPRAFAALFQPDAIVALRPGARARSGSPLRSFTSTTAVSRRFSSGLPPASTGSLGGKTMPTLPGLAPFWSASLNPSRPPLPSSTSCIQAKEC